MSNKLWMRKIEVQVLDRIFTYPDFHININVKKDDREESTISTITIFNLDPSTVNNIRKSENKAIYVKAGYKDNIGNILSGKIVDIVTNWDNVNKGVEFKVREGGFEFENAIYNRTYEVDTTSEYIVRDIVSVLGTSIGKMNITNNRVYKTGKTITGRAKDSLKQIIRESNSPHHIKDNVLYVGYVNGDEHLGFELSPETGLLTTPQLKKEIIDDLEYITYTLDTILMHEYRVDMGVKINCQELVGEYRIESINHSEEFNTTLTVVPKDQPRKPEQTIDNGSDTGTFANDFVEGTANYNGSSNAEIIWNFFISKGTSKEFAAGMLGNLQQESNLDPGRYQSGGGVGRGLAQWTVNSDRWKRLNNMAREKGTDWKDIRVQLDFIWWEIFNDSYSVGLLNRKEGLTPDRMVKLNNINEATRIYCVVYERAGKPMMSRRQGYAQNHYNRFA